MKTYGRVEKYFHIFFTSTLDESDLSASRSGEEAPQYSLDKRLGGSQNRSGRGA